MQSVFHRRERPNQIRAAHSITIWVGECIHCIRFGHIARLVCIPAFPASQHPGILHFNLLQSWPTDFASHPLRIRHVQQAQSGFSVGLDGFAFSPTSTRVFALHKNWPWSSAAAFEGCKVVRCFGWFAGWVLLGLGWYGMRWYGMVRLVREPRHCWVPFTSQLAEIPCQQARTGGVEFVF